MQRRSAKLAAAALRLKRQSGITDAAFSLAFMSDLARAPDPEAIARALPRGAAFVLRDYDAAGREALARRLKAVCARRGVLFLVGADNALAAAVGADGVHWPSWMKGPRTAPAAGLVTASCHNAAELERAVKDGADLAFVSPVFPSASHEGSDALGAETFKDLAAKATLPVLALGGVDARNADGLQGPNVAGFGAIGAFLAPPGAGEK